MAVLFAYTYIISYKYCRYTHVVTLYLSENIYISGCNSSFFILTYMLGHIFCICAIYNKYRCLSNSFWDVL